MFVFQASNALSLGHLYSYIREMQLIRIVTKSLTSTLLVESFETVAVSQKANEPRQTAAISEIQWP